MWTNFLSSNNSFYFPDNELDKQTNLFSKILFFTVVIPQSFLKLINFFFVSIYGEKFQVPTLRLKDAINQIPNRKVLLLIDNSIISEADIVKIYQNKYNLETIDFYQTIT